MLEFSAGVVAGSEPEQIVVTGYDPITGSVRNKLYYTIDQFKAEHTKNGATSQQIEAGIAEARQNILY